MTAVPALAARGWRDLAACRNADADLFFPVAPPNSGAGERQIAEARAVCFSCPVCADCLRFALANDEGDGIWGGTTAGERNAALGRLTQGAA